MLEEEISFFKKRSKDWLTNSIVNRTFPPTFSHELRKSHGGIKPPELMIELIHAFGSNCSNLIDPFVGVGSTLLAASLLKKNITGIDINNRWKDIYLQVCKENNVKEQSFIVGNSAEVLRSFDDSTFDFLITDVPYFSMDKLKQTRGRFSKAGEASKQKLKTSLKQFNEEPIPSFDEWIFLLNSVFKESYRILQKQSILLIFIGNMYRNFTIKEGSKSKKIGKYLLLSSDIAEILLKNGFSQINEVIWMDTGKKLGIYGYPYSWIPSLIDQRILVFSK